MNVSSIIGRLTKDPELKYTQNQTAVTSITIAVDKYNSATKQREADFIPVVVWGKQAESLCEYMRKGSQIGVTGNLRSRNYESNGTTKYVLELVATEVNFLGSKSTTSNENSNMAMPITKNDNNERNRQK